MVKSTRSRHTKKHGRASTQRLFVRRARDMPSQLATLREAVSSFGHLAPHSMRRAARTALSGPGEYAVLGKDGSPRGHLKTFEEAWDLAKDGDVRADSDPTHSEPEYGVFKADPKKRPRSRHTRKRIGGAPPFVSAHQVGPSERARAAAQEARVRRVAAAAGIGYKSPRSRQQKEERERETAADVARYVAMMDDVIAGLAAAGLDHLQIEREVPKRLQDWEKHMHDEGRSDEYRDYLRREAEKVIKARDREWREGANRGGARVSKGGKGSAMREAARLRRDLGPGRGTKRKRSPSPEKRHTRRRHSDSLTAAMKRLQVRG